MHKNVFLGLPVQHFPIMSSAVDGFYPIAAGVNNLNPYVSSFCAARDQQRHQAYG